MTKPRVLSRNLAICLIASVTVIGCFGGLAYGQAHPRAQLAKDPVYLTWLNQDSVDSCTGCHYSGLSPEQRNDEDAFRIVEFSRKTEMRQWLLRDKHAIARRRVEPLDVDGMVLQAKELLIIIENNAARIADQIAKEIAETGLEQGFEDLNASQLLPDEFPEDWFGPSNLLSKRICEKMGWDVSRSTTAGYASFRSQCLTCHGGYRGSKDDAAFARIDFPARQTPTLKGGQPGISCNYCHQIGSNSDWVDQHAGTTKESHAWRLKQPSEKSKAGMRDLTNTVAQVDLCYDCHIGNRNKQMFVTHQMYAAGHPPLPSIEAATFVSEMPPHWRSPSELYESLKDYDDRDRYFQINFPGVVDAGSTASDTLWNTRKMVIGSLVARKKTLDLWIDSASGSHQWADYSLYDCSACHHELRTRSTRQQLSRLAPGRPRQSQWSKTLANQRWASQDLIANIRPLEQRLEFAFASKPFGDPAEITSAATTIRSQLNQAISAAERRQVDSDFARTALMELISIGAASDTDIESYDSARQIAWAIEVVTNELNQTGGGLPESLKQSVSEFGKRSGINTKLPSGRKQFIYPKGLRQDLRLREQYDSGRVFESLRVLGKHF